MSASQLLRDVGVALYGPRWQSDMAKALGVSDRSIRRWVSAEYDLPPGVISDLHDLCMERSPDLAAIIERLKAAMRS